MTDTEPVDQGEYWLDPCDKYREGVPHDQHQVHIAACDHEQNAWCWGIPEPGSVREQVEQLQPGQRVRVVLEGVVEEPRDFPTNRGHRRSVTMRSSGGERFVLRYLGDHPATAATHENRNVDGKINSTIVSVKVLRDPI